jgi:tetratricopeptide (TPR) repeat protein
MIAIASVLRIGPPYSEARDACDDVVMSRWWQRDPGLASVVLAIVAAIALYGATARSGLVNYDDRWLIRDNALLARGDASAVGSIWLDLDPDTRLQLGSEYLPVRDMSILLDFAVWGRSYGAFHATNVAIYAAAIVAWFAALSALGFERRVIGLALLIWAVHPAHAESVAWLSERKGLLGMLFAGLAVLGYARFRRGDQTLWLIAAAVAATGAVWSKAPAAFAVAAAGALELCAPTPRARRGRSLIGLGVLAVVVAAAFVPVLYVASIQHVVVRDARAPASWPAMVAGVHGFYVQLAAAVVTNAVSYPISVTGPSVTQIVLGVLALLGVLAVACVPARRWWRPPAVVRAGAWIWLAGWFPASRLVLPVRGVIVADRYLLFASLGLAMVLAAGVRRLPASRLRVGLLSILLGGLALRTFDARGAWSDDVALWGRAVASSPGDAGAWSSYAEAWSDAGRPDLAEAAVRDGLAIHRGPRLVLRAALQALGRGDATAGRELMREAADEGEFRAMANLATLYRRDGKLEEALAWARKSVASAPQYAHGQRTLGEIAGQMGLDTEAFAALTRARRLDPENAGVRLALARLLVKLGRVAESRAEFGAIVDDPRFGAEARAALGKLPNVR